MMNYEIFKEVVKEKFMDYMPEKFKGMELVAGIFLLIAGWNRERTILRQRNFL